MIVRTPAIPLTCHPYSTTSRIVHWLTPRHGKISTLLKGALRPKSPFLGEYALFSTSELLYFSKRSESLHTGKECSMLHARHAFRSDWRAMQTASYITALFNRTTPVEAPHAGLFELLEELLDQAETHGARRPFLIWSELRFCSYHGHAPHLGDCVMCGSKKDLRFAAAAGGTVCAKCTRKDRTPHLESSPDVLAMLRAWQQNETARVAAHAAATARQIAELDAVMGTFMLAQFNIPIEQRALASTPLQAA